MKFSYLAYLWFLCHLHQFSFLCQFSAVRITKWLEKVIWLLSTCLLRDKSLFLHASYQWLFWAIIFKGDCVANSNRRWRSCLSPEQRTDLFSDQDNRHNISLQEKVGKVQPLMQLGSLYILDFSAVIPGHCVGDIHLGHSTCHCGTWVWGEPIGTWSPSFLLCHEYYFFSKPTVLCANTHGTLRLPC